MAAAVCASVVALPASSVGQGRAAQGESALATRLKQQLGETFQINMLRIDGKSLQVAVNDRQIFEDTYVKLVTTTCSRLGADVRQVSDFAFANRFAEQGFRFKDAAKCADIVKMTPDQQKSAILAATEPL
jgi:hypothetical protein